ncbi:MAG: cytochrome c biogenesis heme-transporting ATPase CcmA [Caldimonas sp.]
MGASLIAERVHASAVETADDASHDVACGSWSGTLQLLEVGCMRGDRLLFERVSARVRPGQLLRVCGPNGSGKTSLLRMVCGLAAPTSGEIRWRGTSLAAGRSAFNRAHLHLGHSAALQDALSALENLVFATALAGRHCTRAQALDALARAGLGGSEHLPARLLSEGQRRRAALARLALEDAPPLWVLDEPFNALDDVASAWLRDRVGDHLRRGGIAVLTSHQATPLDAERGVVSIDLGDVSA